MALLQSVHEDFESEADGCQESGVESEPNSNAKSTIPTDLLPVGYGSKILTDIESRYANIKHELSDVVAGVEKFHTFCYAESLFCTNLVKI